MSASSLGDRGHGERALIRQRIRLAILHMSVLAVIWAVLASFVYSMERSHVWHTVDRQLASMAQNLSLAHGLSGLSGSQIHPIPDMRALVWSRGGTIIAAHRPFSATDAPLLRAALREHLTPRPAYYSLTVQKTPYRVRQWTQGGREVQLFDNTQDDVSRLARLLVFMIWGAAIGLVLSVAGGFALGLWTLRPIVRVREREQRFLSDVAHELRTPLSAMSANIELLIQHAGDPVGDHLAWIETLYSEVLRMTRLVNDLLAVGRLEEGTGAVVSEPVSLREVLETVDAIFRPVLEEAGIGLRLDIREDAVVMGDPMLIRQLLLIFLDNARKHTREGTVVLALVIRGGRAEVHIRDAGEGIALEALHTSEFHRSTGLGLVIARKIADAHGAALSFHSEPGKGTDVVVTFCVLRRS